MRDHGLSQDESAITIVREPETIESQGSKSDLLLVARKDRLVRYPPETVPLVTKGQSDFSLKELVEAGQQLPVGGGEPNGIQQGSIEDCP